MTIRQACEIATQIERGEGWQYAATELRKAIHTLESCSRHKHFRLQVSMLTMELGARNV